MADSDSPDPGALWRDMLGQWEKASNDLANQAMQSHEFGRAVQQASNLTLTAQATMSENFAKLLVGLNLPSRADVMGLGQQVQALDARLARIETLLERLNGGTPEPLRPAVPKPPRTRKPAGATH